jgi:hypothetical protein
MLMTEDVSYNYENLHGSGRFDFHATYCDDSCMQPLDNRKSEFRNRLRRH